MIINIAGVIIWTDDVERLAAFYRDVLEITPHSIQPNFVAFAWGNIRLNIGQHDRVLGESKDPFRVMINLEVNDIHETYERLKDRHVPFIRPPNQQHWGGWIATFKDPDGNILQILEHPSKP